jgi:hypothetical protein
MTAIKVQGKLGANAAEAISRHAGPLFARLGATRLAVVELRSAERMEPAAGEDKEQSVTLRVSALEVANADQEDILRKVLHALYTQRTAYGTLTEDGDLEVSEGTLERAGTDIMLADVARLHAGVAAWIDEGRRILGRAKISGSEMRLEFDRVLKGVKEVIDPALRKD